MISEGLFERFPMDAIFGVHNWPGLDAGQFAISAGPALASSNRFRIRILGKGGHAGIPQDAIDCIPIAAQLIQAFQTIVSRNVRPIDAAVLSVTMIHAGEASNVLPENCEISGTVRTLSDETLNVIEHRMRTITEATCKAYGATFEFSLDRLYPPTINHQSETDFARRVLADIVGAENVLAFEPTMAAEDFSFYLRERPGCYFFIGNNDIGNAARRMLHSPNYDFNDAVIPLGATAWVRLVENWLKRT